MVKRTTPSTIGENELLAIWTGSYLYEKCSVIWEKASKSITHGRLKKTV